MKTYQEFYKEVSETRKFKWNEVGEEAAKLYAQQVAEDVRQRCCDNAEFYFNTEFGVYSIDLDSILDTEIILP